MTLVQPAIEKQQVFCQRRNTREVHQFDTNHFVCGEGAVREEGSGLSLNTDGDYNYAYDAYYNNDDGTLMANFTDNELVYEDLRDINRSPSLPFDLESEDYHCLDMVMVGKELEGISVLKCNSAEGDPGHLTKCCPRLVNRLNKYNI